jgi:type I restriction enzyme R subunit
MKPPPLDGPERDARRTIDAALVRRGWVVQDRGAMDLSAARGVAVREFKMKDGYGFADYLLLVDEKPVGVIEAKAADHTLSGVQTQARRYSDGLPDALSPPLRPLPFLYSSTAQGGIHGSL